MRDILTTVLLTLVLIPLLLSCSPDREEAAEKGGGDLPATTEHEQKQDTSDTTHFTPVWGERLSVTGDFDGDGREDSLTERFISGVDTQEMAKYYDADYYFSIDSIRLKQPVVLVRARNHLLPDLVMSTPTGQLFGLAWLSNEGNVDGRPGDELGVVFDWADFSSINSFNLYTLTDTGWANIWSSTIHDWLLTVDSTGALDDATFREFGERFIWRDSAGALVGLTLNDEAEYEVVPVTLDPDGHRGKRGGR